MTTKFYVTKAGAYLGGYDGAEPGKGAVEVAYPPDHAGQIWDGKKWLAYVPPKEEQEPARRAAYAAEADPLFFASQRGEATEADWLAKVAEIKARFPYPPA